MSLIQRLFKIQIPRWIKPTFYIGTTILILIFNDAFGETDSLIIFSLFFFLLMGVEVIRWLFIQTKSIITLKKEKKEVELLHLKSQVNPHFFFNTLNNLYGLVEQDTVKAQKLILKLSEMMRYSIYEGGNDWVTLDEEITYLENYLELHKMRYHKSIDIRFSIHVTDRSKKVMPLLFIILLENAFKHGVENLRKDAFVHIKLEANDSEINFEVENNFDTEEITEKPGIGLKNLKRRLELVYPRTHRLEIGVTKSIHEAQLTLEI
ncbi:histidine kinase [Gramella sp. MAR_2010_147]|uniref:sensor histidine kinase n=1 Tax=Gramella sp. MAR_2010_147 TaxID=1250205 RepID=UPI00087C9415|nr:histidine kinase [Gramella sp. MAR_2010_147]SDR93815.1 Histidine kinase [Gramella sp. MAR_2010_147]